MTQMFGEQFTPSGLRLLDQASQNEFVLLYYNALKWNTSVKSTSIGKSECKYKFKRHEKAKNAFSKSLNSERLPNTMPSPNGPAGSKNSLEAFRALKVFKQIWNLFQQVQKVKNNSEWSLVHLKQRGTTQNNAISQMALMTQKASLNLKWL